MKRKGKTKAKPAAVAVLAGSNALTEHLTTAWATFFRNPTTPTVSPLDALNAIGKFHAKIVLDVERRYVATDQLGAVRWSSAATIVQSLVTPDEMEEFCDLMLRLAKQRTEAGDTTLGQSENSSPEPC